MKNKHKHYLVASNFTRSGMPSCCGLSIINGLHGSYGIGNPNHMDAIPILDFHQIEILQNVINRVRVWGHNGSQILHHLRLYNVPMTLDMGFASILEGTNQLQMHLVSDNTKRGRTYDVEFKPTDFIKWLREIGVTDIEGPIGYKTDRKVIEVHGFRIANFNKTEFMTPYINEGIKIAKEIIDGHKKYREEQERGRAAAGSWQG